MLAETDDAAVAPACSTSRVTSGRLIFAPRARVGERAGDDDRRALQRRVGRRGDVDGAVLVVDVEVDAVPRSPAISSRTSARAKKATTVSATFGADVADRDELLDLAAATSSMRS